MDNLSISLGSFIRQSPYDAASRVINGENVNPFGFISTSSVLQVCPQNSGRINLAITEHMVDSFPDLEVRFHANVYVGDIRCIKDIIDFNPHDRYWINLKSVVERAGSKIYSAHAGFRKSGTMFDLYSKHAALQDFLGIPVAVEGLYPTRQNHYLMQSWNEWEMVLNSGLPFVVDVSHAAIIANLSRCRNDDLVREMIGSNNCLEIHISGNDGKADQHTPMSGSEWWWPLLNFKSIHTDVFYEGIYR